MQLPIWSSESLWAGTAPSRLKAASLSGAKSLRLWLLCVQRGFFNEGSNFLRPRDVHRMTGTRDFNGVTFCASWLPAFEVWTDGFVGSSDQHPPWLIGHAALVIVAEKLSA